MKKVLALVLAATMALSMASVAFAAEEMDVPESLATVDAAGKVTFQKDDKILIVNLTTPYTASDDKVDNMTVKTGDIEPGTTLYFQVYGAKYLKDETSSSAFLDSGNVKMFTNVSDLKDYRISYSIDDGKNMINSAKFVKMSIKGTSAKGLFVALSTNDNNIMEAQNVDMMLKVSSKNDAWIGYMASTGYKMDKNATVDGPFNRDFTYEEADVSNGLFTVGDKKMVLKFADDADDVTLFFEEDVEIWGNMKGQKNVNVSMKTSNDMLGEKYPDATLRLFEGNKDTFKRDVTVTMPYESAVEKPFLYVVDAKGNLTKLYGGSNAEKTADETSVMYDDVSGQFVFKTKVLNNYIISETELKSKVDMDTPAVDGDKPTDGAQPNPGTGANDFVGLAVALAVVSIAGIAVAKRK